MVNGHNAPEGYEVMPHGVNRCQRDPRSLGELMVSERPFLQQCEDLTRLPAYVRTRGVES
jgi:hypothetical protein